MANEPNTPVPATLKLRGFREPFPSESGLKSKFVTVKAEFRTGRARAVQQTETIPVNSDDVVEVEFADGPRLWLRGDDYRQQFAGTPSRGATGQEVQPVPESLDVLPRGMQSRGPVKWAVKSLKILGVDLEQKTAVQIGKVVDGRTSPQRPGLGLYRCGMNTGKFSLSPLQPVKLSADQPFLIFIHGTASSTWSSFGGLWSAARSQELEALRQAYGDRVLAFEHATLSKSPIDNASELADLVTRLLPSGAKLHLVSHSRGGLVGELLCRANVVESMRTATKDGQTKPGGSHPFSPAELQLFESDGTHPNALRDLNKLEQVLQKKRFQVDRFVRVACPTLGTTLASGRLDRWLSMIGSVATAMPDTPLFDAFKDMGDFAAAVIKERTDPSALPGLEAMMPESALIKLVNWPSTIFSGELTVIAGDIEPDAWWAKLLVFGTDRFYDGDHDLVVNTASMYGGVRREPAALVSFHKGPGVNHFTYFSNSESAKQLVRALTREAEDLTGFELLEKPTVDIARAVVARSAEPRPVVFVLPGIMGSELSVGRDAVWAKIPDLVFGGLGKLRIDARNVRPTQPIARYYGELIEFLAQTHKVVPFAYDWRLPVEQEADRLAQEIRREFEQARQQKQPVRVLAHSMGGLVTRTMIARHSALWREVCAQPGARLLMLGTPNGGSHSITELLVGSSATLRKLALVDLRHSRQELLQIISRFPGVLAMLPVDAREDYFAPQTWRSYHEQAGAGWILPQDQDLVQARRFRQLLERAPLDPATTVYVAGRADVTLAGMSFNPEARLGEQIQFMATARGDGRVTWDSGIPTGVATWYMDVEHGDMPAHAPSYNAFLQLLQNGTTNLLSQTAPVSRAAAELFVAPRAIDEIYPNAEDLEASMLGAGRRRRKAAKPREAPVRVRVVHANLALARHPVAVGHYTGDTIVSAEAHLDRALDGELTRRHLLGLYPGPVGTSALFTNSKLHLDPPPSPLGAIVIGLGTPGALNAGTLSRAFSRAMLDYVIEWSNHERNLAGSKGKKASNDLGLSTLLVGTGAGGVSVPDSVHATLQSVVRTNQALAAARQPQRIREVEFIELWEDRAIQAVRACQNIETDPELHGLLAIHPEMESKRGGMRRVSYEEPSGWWHRVQILGGDGDDSNYCTLRFTATTRRARNEVRLLPTQRALVDQFVEEAIRTTHDNRSVSRTLFEMLLPNELKEQAPDQDDIVLMLDEEAARYPWELLEDPGGSGRNPFVIEHGVLRQLETLQFRESVRSVVERNALVIGDPVSPFVELKGAQAEADAVSRSLEANGRFHVDNLKRPEGDEVIQALCAMPYRVLHLAGHGVYKYSPKPASQTAECGQETTEAGQPKRSPSPKPVTGMVIGDGIYLTPAEIRQMRQVPELVFINCCHLGHIEASDRGMLNERRDQNLIAANVATEFIRMGVHAVVAAGWAVDDGAALTFATAFYDRMLEGIPFGQAVKQARNTTFDLHPQTNTWGAYQCYGDPDYRLVRKSEALSVTQKKIVFVSRQEALVEIANLAARLATRAGEPQQGELEWLADIRKALEEKKWLEKAGKNGKIWAALANVYSEAELFSEAIDHFRTAIALDPSAVTLRDIEQLANLLGRQALISQREVPGDKETRQGKARKTRLAGADEGIDEAIRLLKWLMDSPSWQMERTEKKKGAPADDAPGKTAERLALLGSAYKRKAWISANPGPALEQMKQAYEKASRVAEKSSSSALYPRLNQLFAELILSWDRKRKHQRTKPELRRDLDQLQLELVQYSQAKDSFWDEVMLYDGQLALALLTGSLKGKTMEALADRYRDARRRASPREFASVLDQIEFLADMALKMGKKDIAASLDQFGKALQPPKKEDEKTT